jgi:PAS domain S-box-containing protein
MTDPRHKEDTMRVEASATESSANAIAFTDLQWNLTYVNDAFLKLWGHSDEKEVFGRPVAAFWEAQDKLDEIGTALSTKGIWKGDLVAKSKDGSRTDVSLSAFMVAGENGKSVCIIGSFTDVTLEKKLKESEAALQARTHDLEEVNSTIKFLLKQRDEDKTELAKQMLLNVKELVGPYIDKLKENLSDAKQLAYLNIIESNLNDVVSPFARKLSLKYSSLTPTEIRIAQFVKLGKTSSEMADLLNVSKRTIESHRQKIRKKIGIKNNKANLRSQLMSMQCY